MNDLPPSLPEALVRRDIRHPRLKPGEHLVLDFHAVPWPGQVVLVRRVGRYALALAPTDEPIVAVVRVR